MALISLTTDLGWDSGELAKIKGLIFSDSPKSRLVDISHKNYDFDINPIARKFNNFDQYFPVGSIHLIYYHAYYQKDSQYILTKCKKHFFIAPDNGVLDLICKESVQYYFIKNKISESEWIGELFARTASKIAEGFSEKDFGKVYKTSQQAVSLKPVISKNAIRATIQEIDNFGNLITNLDRETFEQIAMNRKFSIFYKRYDPIENIYSHYGEAEAGEILVRFNHQDFMEIAVNLSRASDILDIQLNDIILIQFYAHD